MRPGAETPKRKNDSKLHILFGKEEEEEGTPGGRAAPSGPPKLWRHSFGRRRRQDSPHLRTHQFSFFLSFFFPSSPACTKHGERPTEYIQKYTREKKPINGRVERFGVGGNNHKKRKKKHGGSFSGCTGLLMNRKRSAHFRTWGEKNRAVQQPKKQVILPFSLFERKNYPPTSARRVPCTGTKMVLREEERRVYFFFFFFFFYFLFPFLFEKNGRKVSIW